MKAKEVKKRQAASKEEKRKPTKEGKAKKKADKKADNKAKKKDDKKSGSAEAKGEAGDGAEAEAEAESPKEPSLSKKGTMKSRKSILKLPNKTLKGKNAPPPKEEEEEEEEAAASTSTKTLKGPSRMMLLKAKGKNLKTNQVTEEQEVVKEEQKNGGGGGGEGEGMKEEEAKRTQNIGLVLGRVKMASVKYRTSKMLSRSAEDPAGADPEPVDPAVTSKAKERLVARRKSATTLRRVSGWIRKKVPGGGLTLRTKMSAITRAIGLTH